MGGVKTAAWRAFRRRSALHRAVKNKWVTFRAPQRNHRWNCMSHRGHEPCGQWVASATAPSARAHSNVCHAHLPAPLLSTRAATTVNQRW